MLSIRKPVACAKGVVIVILFAILCTSGNMPGQA